MGRRGQLGHGDGLHRQVAPAMILPRVTSPRGRFRRGNHPVFPVRLEQTPKSAVLVRLALGGDDLCALFAVAVAIFVRLAKRDCDREQNGERDDATHCGAVVPLGQARGNPIDTGNP